MKPVFHIITLFPEVLRPYLETSILGQAYRREVFDFELIQLRDFASDKHRSVDDSTYGGGAGMVLKVEPLVKAVERLWTQHGRENCTVIFFSPSGELLSQPFLETAAKRLKQHQILICGHYEGADQRFIDHWVDLEISLGDFILTGGELPALAFVDSSVRLLEGTFDKPEAALHESFRLGGRKLLEYDQYTRPRQFREHGVPEILLSGNHAEIEAWRLKQAEERTAKKRPDLFTPKT